MELQLSIFLFIYLIYILVFLFFSFFNLYHMLKYGFVSFWAYVITVGYIIVSLLALFISYYYIAQIDWSHTVDILDTSASTSNFFY
jgi:hypothetical protein